MFDAQTTSLLRAVLGLHKAVQRILEATREISRDAVMSR